MSSLEIPSAFAMEDVGRTVLDNGLVVLTKEVHTSPIVTSMIWYRVGSRNEELGQTGKSHFLEHMLFKGTERFKKGEIDLITLKNGGGNNAFTSHDFTAYYFNFASDRWDVALEIESDRMVNCAFDPEEFEAEKKVVIEELKTGLDSPWGLLLQEQEAAAFKVHPYRNPIVGWLQDVERATAQEQQAYYRRYYHPNNAILVLTGDFDSDQEFLEDWRKALLNRAWEALAAAQDPDGAPFYAVDAWAIAAGDCELHREVAARASKRKLGFKAARPEICR